MSEKIIEIENVSKQYRLGEVSTGTVSHDLNRWWARVRGKEDPTLRVTHANDRSRAAVSMDEYVWALEDINFEVSEGEVLGIIGRNGAGKSTLLKILSRVTAPTTGEIRVDGRIASLLEVGTGFHQELTGRENIFLNGAILGMSKAEVRSKLDSIVDFSGCARYLDTPVKRYSSGMIVRLGFAVAAHLEPEILVVDEVLAVGDAEFQKKCIGKMKDVARHGRTILFVSHNLASIASLTSRCIVLDNGSICFDGASDAAIQFYNNHVQPASKLGRRGPIDRSLLDGSFNPDERLRIEELGVRKDASSSIASAGSLLLDVLVHVAEPVSDVSFGYSVLDQSGGVILNGISPSFDFPEAGSHLCCLDILELPLAPGDYQLSLALVKGDLSSAKYIYDVLLGTGVFEVKPVMKDGSRIHEWQASWGHLIHQAATVQVTNLHYS